MHSRVKTHQPRPVKYQVEGIDPVTCYSTTVTILFYKEYLKYFWWKTKYRLPENKRMYTAQVRRQTLYLYSVYLSLFYRRCAMMCILYLYSRPCA